MSGNATYYKNTTRTISGLVNPVFDTDVVLLCDTSVGAVELLLPEIPSDNFSTQYRLYVVDKSNNALTNNITIKAPLGFSVNNSITAVINVNSGTAIVSISSNKTYNAQFNYQIGGGGGNPIAIKNEGATITPNVSSIDFVGSPVNATAVGNDVTVTIQDTPIIVQNEGVTIAPNVAQFNFIGNLVNATAVGNDVTVEINTFSAISVTYAQITALIGSNSLIPNQTYLITDAKYIQTGVLDLPSATYITTIAIYVVALSTNTITMFGSGIFLNPDFNNVGDYSGVVGFVAQKGIYDTLGVYVIGDVVIWNNSHWKNVTGNNTDYPEDTSVDWVFLQQSKTSGYIEDINSITYQISTNNIISRRDTFNNYVENNITYYPVTKVEAFLLFQWGNGTYTFSNIVKNESVFEIWNNKNTCIGNTVSELSKIMWGKQPNTGNFVGNTLLYADITFESKGEVVFNLMEKITGTAQIKINIDTASMLSNHITNLHNPEITLNNDTSFARNRIYTKPTDGALRLILTNTIFEDNIFEKFNQIEITSLGGNIQENVFIEGCNVVINENQQAISNNYIRKAVMSVTNINFGAISQNVITESATLTIKDVGTLGRVRDNNISKFSTVLISNCEGNFTDNKFENYADFEIEIIEGNPTPSTGKFSFNEITNSALVYIGTIFNGGKFWYNKVSNGSRIVSGLGALQVKGECQYNVIDRNSDFKLLGIDTTGKCNNNTLDNYSILQVDELLQGYIQFNIFDNNTTFTLLNIIAVLPAIGSCINNKLSNAKVDMLYIYENGIFGGNTITNAELGVKVIYDEVQYNVITALSNVSINQGTTVNSKFSNNEIVASNVTIKDPLLSVFIDNQLLNSTFTFQGNSFGASDGVYGNVIIDSTVGFEYAVKGFVNNSLNKSTYLIYDPIGVVYYSIDDWFRGNIWSNVDFEITLSNCLTIEFTIINDALFIQPTITNQIGGGICAKGINTLGYRLDLSDPTIYDLATKTLTIPSQMESFFGTYVLQNGTGQMIEYVNNLTSDFPVTFTTDGSSGAFSINFVVLNNQIGTLVNGICSTVIGGYPQTYPIRYQISSDEITFNRPNSLNLIKEYNAYP